MKNFIFTCLILCVSNVAYAGLFDSVVSQVQQVAQTAQQQAAKQQAAQQQAAQQQAAQQQAAQQQADQQQAVQQQAAQQQSAQQQVAQQQSDQQQASQQQAAQQQADVAETARLKSFWDKEQPRLDEQSKILKIKGLYLGMNIDEACTILSQKMGAAVEVSKVQDVALAPLTEVTIPSGYKCAGVYSNDNKQVVLIIISHQQVDALFHSDGIPGEDFSKKFMEAYNISEMKPVVIADSNAWQYISPDGYKVSIFENKNLLIEPAAKASEMKFD